VVGKPFTTLVGDGWYFLLGEKLPLAVFELLLLLLLLPPIPITHSVSPTVSGHRPSLSTYRWGLSLMSLTKLSSWYTQTFSHVSLSLTTYVSLHAGEGEVVGVKKGVGVKVLFLKYVCIIIGAVA
jgi:hypothetical protein